MFRNKKILVFVFLLSFGCLAFAQQEIVYADTLLAFGKKQMGTKYKYGCMSPKAGFDCSGFVYYVFTHFCIPVPRASMDYEKLGKIIHPDSSKPGDIIVFTGTNAKIRKPGHVGIVLSKPGEELHFIHSSSGKKSNGVIVSNFSDSPYYKKRFIKIVRIDAVLEKPPVLLN